MATWEFPCSDPIDVYVGIAAGSVTVTAELTDVVTVRAHQGRFSDAPKETVDADRLTSDLTVDFENGKLDISEPEKRGLRRHNKSLHLAISVPAESSCTVVTASADTRCLGGYSAVDIRTASGRIDVHRVHGPAEISTMSGGVQIDQAAEPNVQSASGRILVRHATGDVMARTASGNISIGRADASVTARTASGEILINSVAHGRADLNSVSGDVRVRVAQGTGVLLDLASVTGRVSSDLDPSDQEGQEGKEDLQLHSRTVSGAIHVARAVTADVAS
jgi:DUF4097 and DUF4098 domain-containing protein YvlB